MTQSISIDKSAFNRQTWNVLKLKPAQGGSVIFCHLILLKRGLSPSPEKIGVHSLDTWAHATGKTTRGYLTTGENHTDATERQTPKRWHFAVHNIQPKHAASSNIWENITKKTAAGARPLRKDYCFERLKRAAGSELSLRAAGVDDGVTTGSVS